MELIQQLFEMFLHLNPSKINQLAVAGSGLSYAVLFLIIFAETGLVVIPFLPGDSLFFAVGAVTAYSGSPIRLSWTVGLLILAAILGDAINYSSGYYVGPAFSNANTHGC